MVAPHAQQKGFTLIEMIVSLGLFTIVMFVATSAFLSIVNADRKSRATRVAIDNLNLALEDMSRKIKTGTAYSCDGGSDCVAGSAFSFVDQTLAAATYKRGAGSSAIVGGIAASGCGDALYVGKGCLLRADSTGAFSVATSPEIDLTGLKFIVSGSLPCGATATCAASGTTDAKQPGVIVLASGSLPAMGASPATSFKIQTTIVQRAYDH